MMSQFVQSVGAFGLLFGLTLILLAISGPVRHVVKMAVVWARIKLDDGL